MTTTTDLTSHADAIEQLTYGVNGWVQCECCSRDAKCKDDDWDYVEAWTRVDHQQFCVVRLVEEQRSLLGAADCPMKSEGCDGTGYPVGVTRSEHHPACDGVECVNCPVPVADFEMQQCQWCDEKRKLLAQIQEVGE